MMLRLVVGATLALVGPGAASAAPSWCGSDGLSLSERMICADEVLSRLELEASEAYEAARYVGPNLHQERWLAERDRCGMEVSCLEAAYRSRIAELRAVADGPGAGVGEVPPVGSVAEPILAPRTVAIPEPPIPSEEPSLEVPVTSGLPAPPDDFQGTPQVEPDEVPPPDRAPPPLPDQPSGRLAEGEMFPIINGMVPRPWCGAGRLNPTERTICADGDLSRLDALLELVYGRRTARDDDRAQMAWLRSERDACGTDPLCISRAYTARIVQLDDEAGQGG